MRKLLIILFLCIASDLIGAVYYVSKTGSNSNTGTLSSPFLTIQYGVNQLRAGDILYVRTGVYNERVNVTYSGTSASPITITNYSGESPVIDGTGINMGGTGYAFIDLRGAHIKFNGFEVRNVDMGDVYSDGYAIFMNGYNTVSNCVVHDANKAGVLLWNNYNVLEYSTVYNCGMHNSDGVIGTGNAWGVGLRGNFSTQVPCLYNTIRHCTVHTIWGETLSTVYSEHSTIEDNIVYQGGIYVCNSRYALVQRNFVYMTDPAAMGEFTYMGIGMMDEYQGNANSDNTIINNIVYGCKSGFWAGEFGISNCLIANNTFVNSTGEACVVFMPGSTITGNQFVNNIVIQENSIPCLFYNGTGVVFSNNLYNKTPATGGIVSTNSISKTGSFTSPLYYKLNSDSPAINAGVDVVNSDFGENIRSISDIGAWENGTSDTTSRHIKIDNKSVVVGGVKVKYSGSTPIPPDPPVASPIIADHTIVDRYDDIPAEYIAEVKKMWAVNAGESHSYGVRHGMALLEALNATYNSNVRESGTPDPYTTANLRFSSGTWGDYSNSSGWVYTYGEEDWFTNSTGISRTKAGLLYCKNNLPLSALGFGWCWDMVGLSFMDGLGTADPVYGNVWYGVSKMGAQGDRGWGLDVGDATITGNTINLDTYLQATQEYIDYCRINNINTKVYFTTGTVDAIYGEAGYGGYLKNERIRDYVKADASRILFDYADILCYDDNGTQTTTTWNGHTYPRITPTNMGAPPGDHGHIDDPGCLRLAKAMWWMLARIAGWDGN